MDLFEAIKTRKSVRKFKDDIPSKDDVKKIIDAARLAPSGHNKQNWYFIVIYNKDVQKQLKNA
ncbi:MAG: nitroreductase family protein, partial [Cyanobacteriota bacterium]